MLPSNTDLPPAAVTEVASILAQGYWRYRGSLRKLGFAAEEGSQAPGPIPKIALDSPPDQSVHVTVVNGQTTREN
jgi:hypothetical protein